MSRPASILTVVLSLLLLAPAGAGEEAPTREHVLRGLADPAFASRRDAVWAARDHPDPAYLETLLAMARKDPHPNIRAWSGEALARYDDPRVVPTLRAALDDDANPFPRDMALEALGRLHAPGAYELLLAHLEPRSRGSAVLRGLAALGDPRGFDVVLAYWDAHPDDPYVAPAAPETLMALDPARGRRVCLERFADAAPSGRWSIESVLAEAGGDDVRAAMARFLEDADAGLRLGAIRVLAAAGDETTDRLLLERFRKAPGDRGVLADALRARGVRTAAPALAAALPDEKDAVATIRIAVALGRLGGAGRAPGPPPPARRPACLATTERDQFRLDVPLEHPRTRRAALWAWATIHDGEAPCPHESLSGFPEPPDPSVRDALRAARARVR